MLIDFKDDDFSEKVEKDELAVIQFSAVWCSSCQILRKIMEKLSETEEFKEKIKFYYAEVDQKAINTSTTMGVRGLPTVMVFRRGKLIPDAVKVGAVPEDNMRSFLKTYTS
mgnify:FL=1|tara:strand:+ start:203 stop:535 length:333 start_codon:yes stop_codon:yes gene_type:complete